LPGDAASDVEPEFEVQAPEGLNEDPRQTVIDVISRLNKGGFPCDVDADVARFGGTGNPETTLYSAYAQSCDVGESVYTVSSYATAEARADGETFLVQQRDLLIVAGEYFIVSGDNRQGVEAAAAALKATA